MTSEDAKIRRPLIIASALNLFGLFAVWAAQNFISENFWPAAALLFAPQIIFALPALALIALCFRCGQPKLALLHIPALALLLFGFFSFNIPRRAAPREGETVRVMTYNIRYAALGIEGILDTIREEQPDVLCVQESLSEKGFPDPTPQLIQSLSGYHVATYSELLIFSRFPIIFQKRRMQKNGNSPGVLEARLDIKGKPLTVFCAHFSNPLSRRVIAWPGTPGVRRPLRTRDQQVEFLRVLTRRVETPFIVAGDFNMPPRGVLYRQLSRLFRDGFRDSGWGFGYSYPARLPISRIDYIWAGKGTRVFGCHVARSNASDHRPLVAEVALK